MAAIDIDWSAFGEVAGVSLAFGAGVVIVFTLGVLGLSRAESAREGGDASGSSTRTASLAIAGVCFAICIAAVLYGLYLIIPQFH